METKKPTRIHIAKPREMTHPKFFESSNHCQGSDNLFLKPETGFTETLASLKNSRRKSVKEAVMIPGNERSDTNSLEISCTDLSKGGDRDNNSNNIKVGSFNYKRTKIETSEVKSSRLGVSIRTPHENDRLLGKPFQPKEYNIMRLSFNQVFVPGNMARAKIHFCNTLCDDSESGSVQPETAKKLGITKSRKMFLGILRKPSTTLIRKVKRFWSVDSRSYPFTFRKRIYTMCDGRSVIIEVIDLSNKMALNSSENDTSILSG